MEDFAALLQEIDDLKKNEILEEKKVKIGILKKNLRSLYIKLDSVPKKTMNQIEEISVGKKAYSINLGDSIYYTISEGKISKKAAHVKQEIVFVKNTMIVKDHQKELSSEDLEVETLSLLVREWEKILSSLDKFVVEKMKERKEELRKLIENF